MKNKKGASSISILLLVIMTLVLVGAALFGFLRIGKIEERISDVRFVEKVYIKEEQVRFYLWQVAEKALEKSYKTGISDSQVLDDFKKNFEEEIASSNLENIYVEEIKKRVYNKNYDVEFENGILKLSFKDFSFYESGGDLSVDYKTDLSFEIKAKIASTASGEAV